MKKALVLGGLAALSIPAFVSGQVSAGKYIGAFDGQPGSKIKLVVGVADGRGTVREIRSKNFALTCEDETVGAEGSATLAGEIPVRRTGSFKVTDDNGTTTFKTRATVSNNKISGSFRFFGAIESDDGVSHECDSGRQSFTAKAE